MDSQRAIQLLQAHIDAEDMPLFSQAAAIGIRAIERVALLEAELAEYKDKQHKIMLDWRGVETPCKRCGGSGRIAYGNTATWRGGVGGSMMTADVCNGCWGSGDEHRKGVDLRRVSFDDMRALRTELAEARKDGERIGDAEKGQYSMRYNAMSERWEIVTGHIHPAHRKHVAKKTLRAALDAARAAEGGKG